MEYENIQTKEIVLEKDASRYVKEKLGIKLEPVGRFGTYTTEQIECIDNIVEWYFSDVWVKKKTKNELYE